MIAAVIEAALESTQISETARIVLTTGFMGGLTTYSSFNQDSTTLFRAHVYRLAFVNVGATLVLCFVAGLAGLATARAIFAS